MVQWTATENKNMKSAKLEMEIPLNTKPEKVKCPQITTTQPHCGPLSGRGQQQVNQPRDTLARKAFSSC